MCCSGCSQGFAKTAPPGIKKASRLADHPLVRAFDGPMSDLALIAVMVVFFAALHALTSVREQ